ncbi:MAG: DUF6088 family protein [Erysipelotrichaceae bacterium]|nr:DUF6088 family protein [Erysipelotrichaceae bacterium]
MRNYVEQLKEIYGLNTPIFTEEILEVFGDYTRAYVFRIIKKLIDLGELRQYTRGVYYFPKKSFFGEATINSEMVAEKKYIKDLNSVFGIYAGLSLLNKFGITTQVPNMIEIVTNNETTRKRTICIRNRNFIIRKSRVPITEDNYAEYTILQLFTELDDNDILDNFSKSLIQRYIKEHRISKEKIDVLLPYFPKKTKRRMQNEKIV